MTDEETIMDNCYMRVKYYPEINVLEFVITEQFNLDNVEDTRSLKDLYDFLKGYFSLVMGDEYDATD